MLFKRDREIKRERERIELQVVLFVFGGLGLDGREIKSKGGESYKVNIMSTCVGRLVDPSELLAKIEAQISEVSNEALSRKEIMDRIDRWLSACEEENWLEGYNMDPNRFSGGRSAHISLKRAERARTTIKKIPSIVDNLICKTIAWEDEKNKLFLYDGARLVSILEEYKLSRIRKEEEKKRSRDQKKLQDLLLTEKESIYGSKPSPRRVSSFRKSPSGTLTPNPRRNSNGSPTPDLMTPRSYSGRQNGYFKDLRRLSTGPLNFVSIPKEDTMSYSSLGFFSGEGRVVAVVVMGGYNGEGGVALDDVVVVLEASCTGRVVARAMVLGGTGRRR
ncbi:hypothetical protein M8C21_018950 [Ambrosia artemisiifolia]|uniref:Uncharacterized protein n=1 Tax=Ambrosia artemisiifolia TaxID=4212 RepID=A0AAD5GD75_AMBAR|nr:hypothetical protein M8C21_018950 [Ambrosia artemisiifolia]